MRKLIAMFSLCAACAVWATAGMAAETAPKVQFETEILFSKRGVALTKQSEAVLDEVIDRSSQFDAEVIMAIGHTDNSVTGARAQRLSIKRAEAVKTYLAGRGFERNRVYAEGRADRQPVASNASADGRARNNRVQVQILGPRAAPDPNEGT